MTHILVNEDYEFLKEDIRNKEKRLNELSLELGIAAKKSSSFPSNNPEYVSVLDQIHALQASIDAQKEFLEDTELTTFDKISDKKVGTYSLVTTKNLESGEENKYYIHYPNILTGKIESGVLIASPLGPIGKALIGHKIGDKVEISLPAGNIEIKISDIRKI